MAPHTFIFTNLPYKLSQLSLASLVPNLQQLHQDAERTSTRSRNRTTTSKTTKASTSCLVAALSRALRRLPLSLCLYSAATQPKLLMLRVKRAMNREKRHRRG
ncbi:hypothetical protein QBC43DRAFT_317429 [Cladorrhinum sp. PSN259]|nr:hypothetical protein QBC43DRAFT_317429 [Cladorrhinum sp. PSN259]